ncbi:unnamed protein product [Acanthosepion pharaonis]|uniref:Uncharacterized protein n=1 Tax=Acanthosepion pharaonis TaxID=158019 RepID=A0A812BQS8_ACAPH|nr:unnamed protein product [Sepia pharaonis]
MVSRSVPTLCPVAINSRLPCAVRCRCQSDSQLLNADSLPPVTAEDLLGSRRTVTLHHFTEWLYGSGDFRIPVPLIETFHLPIPGRGDAECRYQESGHEQEERFDSLLRRHSQSRNRLYSQRRQSDSRVSIEMNRQIGLRRCASWSTHLTEWTIQLQPSFHECSTSCRVFKIPPEDLSNRSGAIAQATRRIDSRLVRASSAQSIDRTVANENLTASSINFPYLGQPSINVTTVCESNSNGRGRRFESLLKAGRHFRKGLQRLCCQCICVCIYIQK